MRSARCAIRFHLHIYHKRATVRATHIEPTSTAAKGTTADALLAGGLGPAALGRQRSPRSPPVPRGGVIDAPVSEVEKTVTAVRTTSEHAKPTVRGTPVYPRGRGEVLKVRSRLQVTAMW